MVPTRMPLVLQQMDLLLQITQLWHGADNAGSPQVLPWTIVAAVGKPTVVVDAAVTPDFGGRRSPGCPRWSVCRR